jgi:hypothetical protein
MAKETMEREFAVTASADLALANIRGSVDIQPGEDGVVLVTAVKHLHTGDSDRTEIEVWQEEDGRVVVKTHFRKDDRWSFGGRRPCRVDYAVRVPHECSVRVGCVSSSALVQGLEGEFQIKTVSGRMVLKDLSGKVKATSVSGDVFGERISGPTEFESVSGDVFLTESHLPVVRGSSVSGDFLLETALGEGPYSLKTVSGDARLVLPPEAGCTVGFSSMSGRLKTCLPVAYNQRQRHRCLAELQGGGPRIRFNSMSGNLAVLQAL